MAKRKYDEVPDRPENPITGDVWVDYKTRHVVVHVNDSLELRFTLEEADKFRKRLWANQFYLEETIKREREVTAERTRA